MPVKSFRGAYAFLSNFYPSPVELDGRLFPTVENAFQAAKIIDLPSRQWFVTLTPADAKQLGRRTPLRKDWYAVKKTIMLSLVAQKFERYIPLRNKLCAIQGEIVERNHWGDTFWGTDMNGKGKNILGNILMTVRDSFL